MEQIEKIRKGSIWLNVFRTDEGELALTIRKSYPTKEGWKQTNFFKPEQGDIRNIMDALMAFHEFEKMHDNLKAGSQ